MFTPAIQSNLGDAQVLPYDDDFLITNGFWLLVFPDAKSHFKESTIQLISRFSDADDGKWVDYRVICAQEVDIKAKRFRAPRCRKWTPMHHSKYIDPQQIKDNVDRHTCVLFSDDLVDLTDLYDDGKAEAVYANREDKKTWNSGDAQSYRFYYNDKTLILGGSYFRGFREMGMQIKGPLESADGDLPPVGLQHKSSDVFGILMPQKDGNPIGECRRADSVLCWMTEEHSWSLLSILHVFDPLTYNPNDDFDAQVKHVSRYVEAIRILELRGWHEDDILEGIQERLPTWWSDWCERDLERAQEIYNELERNDVHESRQKYLVTDAQKICDRVERAQELLGRKIDLGILPKLARRLN